MQKKAFENFENKSPFWSKTPKILVLIKPTALLILIKLGSEIALRVNYNMVYTAFKLHSNKYDKVDRHIGKCQKIKNLVYIVDENKVKSPF